MQLAEHQNYYPDLTFIDKSGNKFAVDIKSTYRKDPKSVNGMTLGVFTGYFRDIGSTKNIKYSYNSYCSHIVFGLIYSRMDIAVNERNVYTLDDLENIESVVRDFKFFVQDKFRIAADRPGSGNTKNIGSVSFIRDLIHGNGPFSPYGEKVFNDYWMFYMTNDMAKMADLPHPPYSNLKQYLKYRNISIAGKI